jgi:hypothetical protein
MDPAIATIDLVKAGAIVASMVESYLAAAVPPLNAKGADDDDGQINTGAAPVTDGSASIRRAPNASTIWQPKRSRLDGARSRSASSIATSGSLAPG